MSAAAAAASARPRPLRGPTETDAHPAARSAKGSGANPPPINIKAVVAAAFADGGSAAPAPIQSRRKVTALHGGAPQDGDDVRTDTDAAAAAPSDTQGHDEHDSTSQAASPTSAGRVSADSKADGAAAASAASEATAAVVRRGQFQLAHEVEDDPEAQDPDSLKLAGGSLQGVSHSAIGTALDIVTRPKSHSTAPAYQPFDSYTGRNSGASQPRRSESLYSTDVVTTAIFNSVTGTIRNSLTSLQKNVAQLFQMNNPEGEIQIQKQTRIAKLGTDIAALLGHHADDLKLGAADRAEAATRQTALLGRFTATDGKIDGLAAQFTDESKAAAAARASDEERQTALLAGFTATGEKIDGLAAQFTDEFKAAKAARAAALEADRKSNSEQHDAVMARLAVIDETTGRALASTDGARRRWKCCALTSMAVNLAALALIPLVRFSHLLPQQFQIRTVVCDAAIDMCHDTQTS